MVHEQEQVLAKILAAVDEEQYQFPDGHRWVYTEGDDEDVVAWLWNLGYTVAASNGTMIISWQTLSRVDDAPMPYAAWATNESIKSIDRWNRRKMVTEDEGVEKMKCGFRPVAAGNMSAIHDAWEGEKWVLSVNVGERFARWASLKFPEWSFSAEGPEVLWHRKSMKGWGGEPPRKKRNL